MYKIVFDYIGMPINVASELPCDEFMLIYKNAIIDNLLKTEEGRESIERYNRINFVEEGD